MAFVDTTWTPSTSHLLFFDVLCVDFPLHLDSSLTSLCLFIPPHYTLIVVSAEHIYGPWLICGIFAVFVRYCLLYTTY